MINNKFLPFALLALTQGAFAQQPPTSGGQMQQIPPAPAQERPAPQIQLDRGAAPGIAAPDSARIMVNALRVTGAKAYSESQLLAVTGFKPGTQLTLAELRGMATRISDYYRANGYFIAQAYLPPQDIKDGIVEIAVLDGQYGKVSLNNKTRLSDRIANNLLGGLNSGDPVMSDPLETRLLLLSDVPGVNVKSTLAPGSDVGTSDLLVDLTPGKSVTGSVDADNAGNRYTGEYRLGATVNLNNPTGNGDVASVRVLTSGSGLNYARASYQLQLGKARAGVAYSYLDYELGREFASLRAHGTAKIASVFGTYPLIRSRNSNLYAQLAFDDRTFQDKVDSTSSVTDKKARVLMASLYGDHRDRNFGGVTGYSVTLATGNLDIVTPGVAAADAATAQTNGHYNKLSFGVTRAQAIVPTVSLHAALSGQIASKNLDVSEKMGLGGMYGVRAFPQGEAYADQGYLLNLELRKRLTTSAEKLPGKVDLIAFVDTGTVTTNKSPWAAGSNSRTLSGAGIGVNWTGNDNLIVKAYYARKLGSETAISAPDESGRFWIQAIKFF
ncbi:ShlB/FhaC/HecB family hemolysin secretion/activation protein [Lacisediminimonas profundi]|uniref:ShlB/FhaC/HecB family hemolysin secretion/activation protein n=1 Tax=Lacisediminimonas profundi TaxID=2603856 RepID=UPI001F4F9B63|nr:ShlB/FhaC/HecB family hemolysin secretion/activation protein [Lacisediminimonas profundi]